MVYYKNITWRQKMRIESEEFQTLIFKLAMGFLALTIIVVGLLEHI